MNELQNYFGFVIRQKTGSSDQYSCFGTLLKSHFGMSVLLLICCIFPEHLWRAASDWLSFEKRYWGSLVSLFRSLWPWKKDTKCVQVLTSGASSKLTKLMVLIAIKKTLVYHFCHKENMYPIFMDLSNDNLLQKCFHGETRNNNESVNGVILKTLP